MTDTNMNIQPLDITNFNDNDMKDLREIVEISYQLLLDKYYHQSKHESPEEKSKLLRLILTSERFLNYQTEHI